MANRVIFGRRGTDFGLYISKPGFDVLSAGINDMLFHPAQDSLQFVQTGAISVSNGNPVNIAIPDLGYWPMIFLAPNDTYGNFPDGTSTDWDPQITYNSNTSVTINVGGSSSAIVVYVVMRLRADA